MVYLTKFQLVLVEEALLDYQKVNLKMFWLKVRFGLLKKDWVGKKTLDELKKREVLRVQIQKRLVNELFLAGLINWEHWGQEIIILRCKKLKLFLTRKLLK